MVPKETTRHLHDGRYYRNKQGKIKNNAIKNICNESGYLLTFWRPAKKAVNRSEKKRGSGG